ncbi:MAG: anti-sigma factor [Myxococcota bacterium]
MSDHNELLEIAELYALGGVDEAERARFEQHVADGCAECEAALRANLDVANRLLLAVAPVRPADALRERLFARVRASEPSSAASPAAPVDRARAPRRGSLFTRYSLSAAAGVLLVLGLSALSALLGTRLALEREARADLEDGLAYEESISWALVRQTESERTQRLALERRMAGLDRIVSALEAPLARSLALAGQGEFHRATAKAYLEPESGRLILYAHNLPPVPDGRTYQIWVIVQNEPRSVGVFRSDSAGEAKYDAGRLQDLHGPVTVAVTLESEGGASRPTGPTVLAGS